MSMSPEQARKKSEAQAESLKHARYASADGSMSSGNTGNSPAIEAAGKRVDAARIKEESDIGGKDASPNDDRY